MSTNPGPPPPATSPTQPAQQQPPLTKGRVTTQLENRAKQVAWAGVALTAFFVAIVAGDAAAAIYDQSSRVLRATLFTLAACAGLFVGLAYVRYHEAHANLSRDINAGTCQADDPSPKEDWPRAADILWYLALGFIFTSGLAFLVAVWWAADV